MPKQVIVQPSIDAIEYIETPFPIPGDKEIVIKVIVAGSNPKDWKIPLWKNWPHNSGDDLAGIVHSVGKDVYEFHPGHRVAAMHAYQAPNGSFAEYAVAPDWTTFHLPQHVSFEEAATIPLAGLTAANSLYADMKLPPPYLDQGGENAKRIPILIYGVSSAVGAFAAKFARLSGLGPIIGVAGRAGEFGKTLVDYLVDYRNGDAALVTAVEEILTKKGLGGKVPYVFDAISENGSVEVSLRLVNPDGGILCLVLPPKLFSKDQENFKFPPGVHLVNTAVPLVHSTRKDFGYVWSRYLSRLLEDGRLKGHPYEVVPGGLEGILPGLQKLKDGRASGFKYVYRIEETNSDLKLGMTHGGETSGSGKTSQEPQLYSNFPLPPEK